MDVHTRLSSHVLSSYDETGSMVFSEQIQTDKRLEKNSEHGYYFVDYGPIRVRHRRGISQTIATGRRSQDMELEGNEAMKRDSRRVKNRVAARNLKRMRDQIEHNLNQKIEELEREKTHLLEEHQALVKRRAQLTRAVYNAKQTPLIPFVTDLDLSALLMLERRESME